MFHRSLSFAAISLVSCGALRPATEPLRADSWPAMTFAQRRAYMEQVVMPRMVELFRSYSPHAYARMDCAMCHGSDGESHRYRMPNPDLLLTAQDAAAGRSADAELINRFMTSSVEPAMARLLGARPFDPETGSGYGCFGCHTLDR